MVIEVDAAVEKENRNLSQLADLSVREIKTLASDQFIYRAISGVTSSQFFLIIEKISRKVSHNETLQLLDSWKIQNIKGGEKIKLDNGWFISDLSWNMIGLQFKNQGRASGSLINTKECEVQVFVKTPVVICK